MIGFYDYTVIATYLATAAGIWGVFLSSDGRVMEAVVCLLVAGLLDAFDGRIARTKKNRTEQERQFGIQIDSLNDLICFGVLPAMICRTLFLENCGRVQLIFFNIAACLFLLAGLIRLAFFNVAEEERQQSTKEKRRCYMGLPITTSSLICPLLYLLSTVFPGGTAVILIAGLLCTGLFFILPLQIPKPGLKGIAALSAVGAAELGGLIHVAMQLAG